MDTETTGKTTQLELESIPLKSGLNLEELKTKGADIEILTPEDKETEVENDSLYCDGEEAYKHIKSEMDGIDSSEDDDEEEDENKANLSPFERVARHMIDISPDQDKSILKQVIRPGIGPIVEPKSQVTVHYNAYLEYRSEPYDSTYLRNKKFAFRLGEGEVIPGLDLSISTMSVREKAKFIVTPDWGYGEHGCMPRIPENASLLFEVDLVSALDNYAAEEFKKLSTEEQEAAMFSQVIKVAKAEHQTGNSHMTTKRYDKALECYYRAIRLLENATINNEHEKNETNDLLLKLYQNQCLVFDRLGKFRKVQRWANKALEINPNSSKALFRLGRAHNHFSEWNEAREFLIRARTLEPNSTSINEELVALDTRMAKHKIVEETFCRNIFSLSIDNANENSNSSSLPRVSSMVSEDFKNLVVDNLTSFKSDETTTELLLPKFNDMEVTCVAAAVKVLGDLRMELCRDGTIKIMKM